MRGLTQGMTALALVGGAALAPQTAGAVASFDLTVEGTLSVENNEGISVSSDYISATNISPGEGPDAPFGTFSTTSSANELTGSSGFAGYEYRFFGVASGDSFYQGTLAGVPFGVTLNNTTSELKSVEIVLNVENTPNLVTSAPGEIAELESLWVIYLGGDVENGEVDAEPDDLQAFETRTYSIANMDAPDGEFKVTVDVEPTSSETLNVQHFLQGTVASVPLPAALPMLGAALAGLGFVARRRARSGA